MCTISIDSAQLVEDVITNWTQQKRMFSLFEVSKEVQARLIERKLPFERHQELRSYYDQSPVLRDALQSTYNVTLRPMEQGLSARVYHPVGSDASQYMPLDRKNGTHLPPQVPSSNVVTSGGGHVLSTVPFAASIPMTSNGQPLTIAQPRATPRNGQPHDPNITEVNKSDELWVPIPHVKVAGFHPGDTVDVDVLNDVVTFKPTLNNSGLKHKTVESYGNLRLYRKERTGFGLTSTKFKVESELGKVTLTSI
jgi:hypothetical protein